MDYIEEEPFEGREVTQNEAYLHIVKLDKKNRMFGAGDLAKSIGSDLSTGTSHFHPKTAYDDRFSQLEQQLEKEREERKRLAEQIKKLQEMVETLATTT